MNQIVYEYDDAFKKSLEYFNNDELATKAFLDKYALKDNDGNILECNPTEMHKRLAKEFARIEKKYPNAMSEDEIFSLIDRFKYIIPQGSPMSAIGNPYQIQSSGNCFSIKPPYDSYGGIFYSDQQLAQLMKRRCGVGLSLSTLRPKGSIVQNAAKTTDGISVFMERYSNTCREVAQGGRRGALILLLSVHHPEIKTFINIKRNMKKVTGANISIQVTDEFMNAVKRNDEFELRWPVDSKKPIISQKVSAKEVWDNFIESSWESAEPGILFWDTVLKNSVSNCYGVIDDVFYDTACNPCGEIVMGTDSCRLLAINLYSFVNNKFKDNAYFDYEKFSQISQKAQRMMDDMVDLEIELIQRILDKINSDEEPEYVKEIEKKTWEMLLSTCKKGRRTGLGLTGLGDTIAALNVRYGSEESVKITEQVYKTLCLSAYKETCILAKERGAFPIFNYDIEKDNLFLNRVFESSEDIYELYKKHGRRNIALTTTPPAGTISLLTRTTSGIEPAFMIKYRRRKKINPSDNNAKVDFVDQMGDSWQEFDVYHHAFKEWMDITGKTNYEDSPYYKATSSDINWEESVDIQSAAQKWICHAISKTCNVPKNTSKETIEKVYMRAWEKQCKGFTIYRDGSRDGVLINKDDCGCRPNKICKSNAPKRPESLPCDIYHVKVKDEAYFVIVGLFDGKEPYEVFAGKNKLMKTELKKGVIKKVKRGKYALCDEDTNEHCEIVYDDVNRFINEEQEVITRMISSNLRHGTPIEFMVHQLEKSEGDMQGFSKAISRVLKKYIKDGTKVTGEVCSKCGGGLTRQDGCQICLGCGWSKCG